MASQKWSELYQQADDSGGAIEAVPAGQYEAEVAKVTPGTTANKKKMFKTRFKITEGPYAGKPVFENFVLSPESPVALGIFFRQLKTLGLGQEFFNADPTDEQIAEAMTGAKCKIKVSVRQWKGEDRNDVDDVVESDYGPNPEKTPGSGGAVPDMGSDNVASDAEAPAF